MSATTETFIETAHSLSDATHTTDSSVIRIFHMINYGFLCEIINIFGITTNIINIKCFVRQGLKDAVNISLTALAISDLGCLLTMLWTAICKNPLFEEADLPFYSIEVNYLTSGVPHIAFTRTTCAITALIMVERCLCITMPLKVKNILHPRRVVVIIVCIYIFFFASLAPIYYIGWLAYRFDSRRNKTMFGIAFNKNRELVEKISFGINIIIPYIALLTIISCMIIITYALRKQAKWRGKCTGTSVVDSKMERDQKVAKMVIMISVLFVICFTPSGIVFTLMIFVTGYDYTYDITLLYYSIAAVLECANSATNIFIYYHMSSKYRKTFRRLFGCGKGQEEVSSSKE